VTLVVDASVVVELLLRTPAAAAVADRLFGRGAGPGATPRPATLHAPQLLDVEVAQVLRRYVLRGDLAAGDGAMRLAVLKQFPVARYSHGPLLDRIWTLRSNLTAYDAAYVALAEALGATLVTRDARLAAASGIAATVEVI
jgi:predicted nucleic acid-binding protein